MNEKPASDVLTNGERLWDLMDRSEARALTAYEVSRALNNARNDSPELILPVGDRAAAEVLV